MALNFVHRIDPPLFSNWGFFFVWTALCFAAFIPAVQRGLSAAPRRGSPPFIQLSGEVSGEAGDAAGEVAGGPHRGGTPPFF